MGQKTSTAIAWVLGLIVALALVYGLWQLGRTINYNLSYEDMVEETICDMVKPEHLKNPKECN